MTPSRSRFSRRHLLALCSFLIPLAVLAILGWSELRRQGDQIEAGLLAEAQLYLENAESALEGQIDFLMQELVAESRDLVGHIGAIEATQQLQGRYSALLDIVVLDEQSVVLYPPASPSSMALPFADEPKGRGPDVLPYNSLNLAELWLAQGHFEKGAELLEALTAKLEKAKETRTRSYLRARFKLATAHRRLGRETEAIAGFETVRDITFPKSSRRIRGWEPVGLMCEIALAEYGDDADRMDLLARMASDRRYTAIEDGFQTAVVERIVEGIDRGSRYFTEAQIALAKERQRAQTRAFAADYDAILKGDLRLRLRQSEPPDGRTPPPDDEGAGPEAGGDVQIVATLGQATTMLWVRDAEPVEKERYDGAARIGLHVDLGALMAPALGEFLDSGDEDNEFVIAIGDPEDSAAGTIVPPPVDVPPDWVPPSVVHRGIKLSVYPADSRRLLAESNARTRNRLLLFLVLFVAAMAGALWLWRSVNRESELAALKVDLVSRVSHELKTPIALIRMYGETLMLGRVRDDEQSQHFGGIITRESERLTTMIQRILDFSRQQAGTLTYSPTEFDLGELLREIADAYAPHLESRGVMLSDTVHGSAWVRCDQNACESAVLNLLENAAKYSLEGDDDNEIELDLRVDEARSRATIEVRDHGRGIPQQECDQVFDAFFRASNSGEVRGAGIGLSLVRHFAQSHDGDAEAEEREGGGAIFRIVLPLARRAGSAAKNRNDDS